MLSSLEKSTKYSYINSHKVLVANGAHVLQHMSLIENCVIKF